MSSRLNKSISVWQGIALYVGAVVGSGILILPGMTAGIAGADALFSWGGMILTKSCALIPRAYQNGEITTIGAPIGGSAENVRT